MFVLPSNSQFSINLLLKMIDFVSSQNVTCLAKVGCSNMSNSRPYSNSQNNNR